MLYFLEPSSTLRACFCNPPLQLHLLLGRGSVVFSSSRLVEGILCLLNPDDQCGEFKTTVIAAHPIGVTLVSNPPGAWLTDAPALCVVSHISALCLWCGFLCRSHWMTTMETMFLLYPPGRIRTRRQSSGSTTNVASTPSDSRGRSRAKVVSQSQRKQCILMPLSS